jgi:hypothetical protein
MLPYSVRLIRAICGSNLAHVHLNMHMDLDQLWHSLENTVSPEITHFRNRTHPGPKWWLKTACVSPDHIWGILSTWRTLAKTYPGLVKVTSECYDWQGNLIPWACSIWMHVGRDILLEQSGSDWIYHVMSTDVSKDIWDQKLQLMLRSPENKHLQKCDVHTWHKWQDAIQLHTTWCSESEAQNNRKQMRVIHDSQDSSSCTNP